MALSVLQRTISQFSKEKALGVLSSELMVSAVNLAALCRHDLNWWKAKREEEVCEQRQAIHISGVVCVHTHSAIIWLRSAVDLYVHRSQYST